MPLLALRRRLWAVILLGVTAHASPGANRPCPFVVQDPAELDYDRMQWEFGDNGYRYAYVQTSRSSEFVLGEQARVHRTAQFVVKKNKQDRKPLERRATDKGLQDRSYETYTEWVCW